MTETSVDSPSDERDFQTLHKNTTRAELFPAKQHKEEWWEEAEHEGSSLSRYLYDLIQEARMYRDSGAPFIQTQDQTVKQPKQNRRPPNATRRGSTRWRWSNAPQYR